MAQNSVCIVLGWELKKSQAESWAVAACGISLSWLGLTEWMRSGNWIASWMKNTGMLLPTMSVSDQSTATSLRSGSGAKRTEVTLVGIEPGGKAVDISSGICTTARAGNCC
jgi:hypothetical protein